MDKEKEEINKENKTEQNNNKETPKEEIGKVLKVFTNELTFGKNDRQVNVFGLFKYKKNSTNYIVYGDVNDQYNIVYYATAHIKGNSILTLDAKKEEDNNAVKEYIFKITNNESMTDYERLSLKDIDTIEIIGFSKIEVKPEVISSLIELTIPKKKEEQKSLKTTKKKKSPLKTVLLILIIACLGGGAYIFFTNQPDPNMIVKSITCKINYDHQELEAIVYEEKTFNFNNQDNLENIDTLNSYVFNTTNDYLEFVNKGLYFKYMPGDDEDGGYSLDDENNTYKITTKEKIDEEYAEATAYEEVLTYYKSKGYTCEESISQ